MDHILDRTDPTLLVKAVQRLRKNTIVKQTEKVPFGTCFRFEVPKHPAIGFLFENSDLGGNVKSGVFSELLAPLVDVIDGVA